MIEMNHWKLDNIFECLRQAGAVALKFRCAAEVALKPDHTVVTIADREIEAMLAAKFNRPEAGCYMIGEESIAECSEAYLQEAFRNLCYVVDPIDGTAPYSTDVPLWGISIGLMENGVLTEGAIYLPGPDEALVSCRGTIWSAKRLQGNSPEVAPFEAVRTPLGQAGHISVGQFAAKHWDIRLPNQIFAWSSCVGSGYYLLKGLLLAYVLRSKLWDLAGVMPLVKAAGFEARFPDGAPFDFRIASGGQFALDAAGPHRWRLNDDLIIAPDREAIDYIRNHVTLIQA
ncbi:MAG: hypothetical protein DBX90_02880 [Lentisphaerae bacterium]|nr:MAG: hypothetical protein DBX90_02880 [Lentisphaerota bacterium]